MEIIRYLYTDRDDIPKLLDEHRFARDEEYFVKIFSSDFTKEQAVDLAVYIKTILPQCEIMGASSSNIIFKGEIIEKGTMILIEKYDHQKIKKEILHFGDKCAKDLAKELASRFDGFLNQYLHILVSDQYHDANDFVKNVNIHFPNAKLVGGLVTPNEMNKNEAFLFTEEGVLKDSILVYTLVGEKYNCYSSSNTIDDPISSIFEITKMDGSYIEEIDNEDALTWVCKFLKLDNAYNDLKENGIYKKELFLQHFILLLSDYQNIGRYIKYDSDKRKLYLYHSKLDAGTKFRIGYVNPIQVRENAFKIYNSMSERYIESLFCYICDSRRNFLTQMMYLELAPLKTADVCGLFLAGEICYKEGVKNQLFNGSMITTEIAEEKVKANVDMDVFYHSARIDVDNSIVDFVMQEKRNEIQKQSQIINDLSYSKLVSNLPNTLHFREDCKKYHYNKSAIVYVENADIIIGYKGYENYILAVEDIINQRKMFFSDNNFFEITGYMLNYCTFLATTREDISDEEFLSVLRKSFEKFRIMNSKKVEVSMVAKFVVVLGKENLLEKSIFATQKAKELNLPYYVHVSDDLSDGKLELQVVALLRKVIETKEVIPYYQGIYNNEKKKITRYEALMRIIDKQKKVYSPDYFMNIAVKYNLYAELSKIMIEKVLKDFEYKKETVNINISPIDMLSDDFCNWFWSKIEKYPHPENIVLEIVETDHAHDEWIRVKNFINKAKTYHIGIAIDDFGKDYSNMMRVLQVEPGYIKIDGSIVKEICYNPNSKVILQTVNFLSESINADVVAEYVENEQIQYMVNSEGIEYSQGYYFAKPLPFEEIDK